MSQLIYSGSVSNSGDVTLGDIIITDNKAGFVAEVFALAPGETEDFFSFFTPTNCGPGVLTIVTAMAFDVCTGVNVTNQTSASCLIICPPNQPPLLTSPKVGNNQFSFSFGTEVGRTYTVQYTQLLLPANWQTLTNFSGTGGNVTINDPATNQQRYYRVLVQ